MAENSKIEWTDHTFNPWVGCQKVGPGCDHCYAEGWAKRSGLVQWGPGAERRLTSEANWKKPLKWNEQGPARVFCASLADVFDNQAPEGARGRLFDMIRRTPNLMWLLLTKRVGNVATMLPGDWGSGYPNVTLMITVVTQEEADRDIPRLLDIPATLRGLSMEPLLEPVELSRLQGCGDCDPCIGGREDLCAVGAIKLRTIGDGQIHWVIVGGESGPGARYMYPDWARSIRDQCRTAGAAFFMKQMTGKKPIPPDLLIRELP